MSPTYSVCKSHGYIAGEAFTCPECGATTEVYSRITGYYRPVQNWNDGKSQEYKDRKVYDIANSKLNKDERPVAETQEATAAASGEVSDGAYLFTTATCPNCKIACSVLDKAGVHYTKLLANENAELTTKLGVKQAPTLVIIKDGEISKYHGVSDIKKLVQA